ncbi:suppressor of rasval19 [Talaromyces marneffei ATCC 18224]
MAGNQMHNMTTLIKRLEAATSRLEDMAMSFEGASPTNHVNLATPVQQAAIKPSTQAPSPLPRHPNRIHHKSRTLMH